MAQIFFIDPIEKLNIKKDSTLMLASEFKKKGIETYLLFEKDFYIRNDEKIHLEVYDFDFEFLEDGYYLKSLLLKNPKDYIIGALDTIHMRIDPPYDTRYQRYLWMLDFISNHSGANVVNNPLKIMKYNEKLVALTDLKASHESFIGSSESGFKMFIESLKKMNFKSVILKPLDLYSGIGVEKADIDDQLLAKFHKKVKDFHGAIVCQPFIEDVYNGEIRSIYMDGVEIGSIIKKPNKGEYLANIAQGAKFEAIELDQNLKNICDQKAQELYRDDVRLIAFDILGGKINEINITCPGLIVEVSYAHKKNLASLIADKFL